jgi:hypothetical protein
MSYIPGTRNLVSAAIGNANKKGGLRGELLFESGWMARQGLNAFSEHKTAEVKERERHGAKDSWSQRIVGGDSVRKRDVW